MGPTAAGKTDLALEWVESLPFEIVSVDSAMIYRGLDIGTGKPSREILARVPHHLVDIRDPAESYSAGQFVRDARRLIAEIRARNKVPLLVGGTMLYYRALVRGIADLPEANAEVRTLIDTQARDVGWPAMHAELARIDPQAAARILVNDAQRIQRALEVYRLTGTPLSSLHAAALGETPTERYLSFVWNPADRAVLYERIERRFGQMMNAGLLAEVQALHQRKELSPELPALRSVGYRQLLGHLAGAYDLEEGIRLGIIATRHLARRQLIWLRSMDDVEWFDSLAKDAAARIRTRIEATLV